MTTRDLLVSSLPDHEDAAPPHRDVFSAWWGHHSLVQGDEEGHEGGDEKTLTGGDGRRPKVSTSQNKEAGSSSLTVELARRPPGRCPLSTGLSWLSSHQLVNMISRLIRQADGSLDGEEEIALTQHEMSLSALLPAWCPTCSSVWPGCPRLSLWPSLVSGVPPTLPPLRRTENSETPPAHLAWTAACNCVLIN